MVLTGWFSARPVGAEDAYSRDEFTLDGTTLVQYRDGTGDAIMWETTGINCSSNLAAADIDSKAFRFAIAANQGVVVPQD